MSDLLERMEEGWMSLSRLSFDRVDAGIAANLCQEAMDEISRLREAKQAALRIADERSKENVALRASGIATVSEKQAGHKVVAWLFEPAVRDMGGGLRIVTPDPNYLTVEMRDVIVKAVQQFIR